MTARVHGIQPPEQSEEDQWLKENGLKPFRPIFAKLIKRPVEYASLFDPKMKNPKSRLLAALLRLPKSGQQIDYPQYRGVWSFRSIKPNEENPIWMIGVRALVDKVLSEPIPPQAFEAAFFSNDEWIGIAEWNPFYTVVQRIRERIEG